MIGNPRDGRIQSTALGVTAAVFTPTALPRGG